MNKNFWDAVKEANESGDKEAFDAYHEKRVKESEEAAQSGERWWGVDLDGTLAEAAPYYPYPDEIGPPVEQTMLLVKNLMANGIKVKIFTARAGWDESMPHVKEWLKKHGLGHLEVTNVKDMYCDKIVDDKAIQAERNTGNLLIMHPGGHL